MSIFDHLPGNQQPPEGPGAEPDPDPVEAPSEATGDRTVPAADLPAQASTTTARAAGGSVLNKTAERGFVPSSQNDPRALADRVFLSLRGQFPRRDKRLKPDRPKQLPKRPDD